MFAVLQYSEWADRIEVLDKVDQWLDTWFPQASGRLLRWMATRLGHAYQLVHLGAHYRLEEAAILLARLGFWTGLTSEILNGRSEIIDDLPAVEKLVERVLRRDCVGIVMSYCYFY